MTTIALPSLAAPNLDAITSSPFAAATAANSPQARARAQAEGFETQFLNSMFQEMYKGIGGEGPFGNSAGVGPWRSFLTEEYAKAFVKKGGIGIADAVYKTLMAHQEARQSQAIQQGSTS